MYESGENYLETILMLHQKQGYVRSIDIANELGFTKPSVSRAMSILKNDGYIVVESSGNIVLTEKEAKKPMKFMNATYILQSSCKKY